MPTYVPPKNAAEFIFYVSLVSQADPKLFQVNPTLAAGDVKVSIDGGAEANLATLPAVTPAGSRRVKVTVSAAEMTGDNIQVTFVDAAGAQWCDLTANIQTSARQIDDLAFPFVSGRSLAVDVNKRIDVGTWLGVAPAALTASGYVQSVVLRWLTDNAAGTPAALTANGFLQSMLLRWLTDNAAGTPGALIANRVDSTVGAMQANTLTASAIAAAAITAAKYDVDAIDAVALAASAVTEIVNGIFAKVMTELAAVPAATPTFEQSVMLQYMAIRNRRITDSGAGTDTIETSAGAIIMTANITFVAGVFTKAKYA